MDLAKATAGAVAAVNGVRPDQFGAPTPCRDWDVATLTNHLLQVVTALELAGRREPVPSELWERDMGPDRAAFEEIARKAVAAWDAAAAPTVIMGESPMPADFVAAMLASDLVIHGWDLARATGQDYRVDDDIAEAAARFVAETGEQGRSMGIYGEPVPTDDDATTLDRAVALSGRDPRWDPPRA